MFAYPRVKETNKSSAGMGYSAFEGTLCNGRVSVDYFNKSAEIDLFFLTHFHSDHFPGLTRDFFVNRTGSIVCSETTKCLLLGRFGPSVGRADGIPEDRIVVLDPGRHNGRSFPLSGDPGDNLWVEATDCCRHCDGALMFWFEHPQCNRVLHTGDFRWTDSEAQREALEAYRGKANRLVVDTTFCDLPGAKGEMHRHFPSQDDCIKTVLTLLEKFSLSIVYISIPLMRQAHKKNPEALRFRALGQELLLAGISKATKMKLHVDGPQLAILSLMPTLAGCLTSDGAGTRLHLCEKGCANAQYAMWAANRRTSVDVNKPRGCEASNQSTWPGAAIVLRASTMWFVCKQRRMERLRQGAAGAVQSEVPGIYHVLWSMHSSAAEVENFVHWMDGGTRQMHTQSLRRELPEPPTDFRNDDEPDADESKPLHLQVAQEFSRQRARTMPRRAGCHPAVAAAPSTTNPGAVRALPARPEAAVRDQQTVSTGTRTCSSTPPTSSAGRDGPTPRPSDPMAITGTAVVKVEPEVEAAGMAGNAHQAPPPQASLLARATETELLVPTCDGVAAQAAAADDVPAALGPTGAMRKVPRGLLAEAASAASLRSEARRALTGAEVEAEHAGVSPAGWSDRAPARARPLFGWLKTVSGWQRSGSSFEQVPLPSGAQSALRTDRTCTRLPCTHRLPHSVHPFDSSLLRALCKAAQGKLRKDS